MAKALLFGEVLEAIDTLSLEDQETLEEILRRRIIERRRAELVHDVQEAQQEFQAGQCRPVTPEELMQEIGS
jgi:preprotein translocase subunit SecA